MKGHIRVWENRNWYQGEETAGNESLAKNTSCCEFRIMRRIMISVTIAIMALVRVGLLFTTGT